MTNQIPGYVKRQDKYLYLIFMKWLDSTKVGSIDLGNIEEQGLYEIFKAGFERGVNLGK